MFTWGPQSTSSNSRLVVNFEDSIVYDEVTGIGFTGGTDFAAGKFGDAIDNYATWFSSGSGAAKNVSDSSSSEWDVTSPVESFTLHCFFNNTNVGTSSRPIVRIREVPNVSNDFVSLSVFSTSGGTLLRFEFAVPIAPGFVVAVRKNIPYDTGVWHHVCGTWESNGTLRISVDGSATTGTDGGSAGNTEYSTGINYRRPAGDRQVIIGNTSSTGVQPVLGKIDAIELCRGLKFDIASGFTPPTAPPAP